MNTPAHLLIGAAAFGKKGRRGLIWAAMAGAVLPDLSLYLMAGTAIFVLGIDPRVVFDELYFSHAWQTVFSVDNSFFVWGALFLLAMWRQSAWGMACFGAGLLHLCLDFPLHHDDGRAHFWPLTDWVFRSPLSYWDHRHGANWVAPLEAALAVAAAVRLWIWRPGWKVTIFVGMLLAAELSVTSVWRYVFSA